MKVIVPHHSTQQAAISILDRAADRLLAGAGGNKNIRITDQKKAWDGPVMNFAFTGRMGFISVPLSGTVAVDDANVTVECELPPMVKNFVGEEKVRGMVADQVAELMRPVV